jgi:quercetin dioxygenase-like cupin family protein
MKSNKLLFALVPFCLTITAYAQHDHSSKQTTSTAPMTFNPVLTQALSDPELKDYKMESMVMTIAPGAVDTVSHRHDCELFGYVMEGEVQIGLEKKEPNSFLSGQMFYEKRNVLHSLARNPNKEKVTKVLLIFLIKNGRVAYTPEYPEKKSAH